MSKFDDLSWFERLAENPHIISVMVADNRGHVLRSTYVLGSEGEHVASILQSFETLGQALALALDCGSARMMQITTDIDHVLLFPLFEAHYFLAVQASRKAPLMLLMVEMERVLTKLEPADMVLLQDCATWSDDTPVLDAEELIEAVREWLQSQSPRADF